MRLRPFGMRRKVAQPRARRAAGAVLLLLLAVSVHAQEAVPPASEPMVRPAPVMPTPSRPVLPATTSPATSPATSPVSPRATPPATSAPTLRPRATAAAPAAQPEPAPDPMAVTLAGLNAELRELRAANDRLDENNGRLTELNGQLRQEVEALALELQAARRDARLRGLLYGAGLILAGLLAGVLVKARPRRSAWS